VPRTIFYEAKSQGIRPYAHRQQWREVEVPHQHFDNVLQPSYFHPKGRPYPVCAFQTAVVHACAAGIRIVQFGFSQLRLSENALVDHLYPVSPMWTN